jgi:hypothetical protein
VDFVAVLDQVSALLRQQARAALAAAIDLYRDMEMAFWLPQTEAALARVVQGTLAWPR